MGWTAAITAGTSIIAARQASATAKYNQAVQNRNAKIAEQEAEQIDKQLQTDLVRFDKQFQKLQGQTTTSIIKSGAELSGSGLRVMRYNAEQAQLQTITQTGTSLLSMQG